MYEAQIGSGNRWDHYPQIIDDLKKEAKQLGLWNMFLPKGHYKESPGFTNLEYGLMAEYLGKSRTASEAVNCAAPDTGNMEVFAKYGTEAQKRQWLKPLMDGEIRSAFLMTEPDIASSDASNIEMSMKREGNYWVLNGSVSEDPQCSDIWADGNRNGGLAVLVTQDARSILSWPRVIREIRIYTDSNPLFWYRQTHQALLFSECCPCTVMTMPPMDTGTSRSKMFVFP